MATELRPCPFCGGEAKIVKQPLKTRLTTGMKVTFWIGCANKKPCYFIPSSYEYGDFPTEQQAIAAWNKREVKGE